MIDREELRRQLGEAACDSDDRRRLEVESVVAESELWAKQEWTELLDENEALRTELRQIGVPANLESRLLAAADNAVLKTEVRPLAAWRWGWAVAVAASLLAVLGIGLSQRYTTKSRMRTVALLAINNHLNHLGDHQIDERTADRREVEEVLSDELRFEVRVPNLDVELRLVGGRKCKLGTHEVAFTLWEGQAGDCSLFQFQPADFGLPHQIRRNLVRSTEPAGDDFCGAWIWCEGASGYVLVGDPGTELERLSFGE